MFIHAKPQNRYFDYLMTLMYCFRFRFLSNTPDRCSRKIILSTEALEHDAPTAFAFVQNEDHP